MEAAYLNPSDVARALAAGPCVVYFTKRDGTERRMMTAPAPEGVTVRTARDGDRFARVLDAEAGEPRQVNVTRCSSCLRLAASRAATMHAAEPIPAPAPRRQTVAEIADDIFGPAAA